MAVTAPKPRTRPRAPLTRERIARAALGLIERKGLEGLTMRALGARLKVEAMSLYHHVPSRDAVLDLVMDLLVAEVETPAEGPWPDRIRKTAWSHREAALRHPHAWPLLLTRPYTTETQLTYCDRLCALMGEAGLDPQGTAVLFRLVGHYLDGALLYTALGPGRVHDPAPPPEPVDPRRFPALARVGPHLRRQLADAHFEFGLERIIEACVRAAKRKA